MLLQLMGVAGSGKSFSLKNLNPNETVIIDTDMKGLSWSGWRADYSKEKKNYIAESNIDKIKSYMLSISKNMPHVKIMVVDTINTILTDYLFAERKKTSFDKWKAISDEAYGLYEFVRNQIPEDVIVIIMAHTENYKIVNADYVEETHTRVLYPGSATTKSNLNKFLQYSLMTEYHGEEPNVGDRYKIRTQTNGRDEVRSMFGVLPNLMPNVDIVTGD